jgi:outer membrane immunogenic protein
MKRILVVALAAMAAASGASAADLPVPAGPAPAYIPYAAAYNWGGGYVGINGGYAFGQSQWSDPNNPSLNTSSGNFNVSGGLIGLTMGVSGQSGSLVYGVEGDFDWQGVSGTSTSNNTFCTSLITSTAASAPAAGLSCKSESTWLGTFRARLGYAWDRVLVYGTAGGAGASLNTALNGLPVQNNANWGWTAGAGIEVALADNWTAKIEYLFVDLLSTEPCNHGYSCGYDVAANGTTGAPAVNSNNGVKFNENIIRVGLNFKFGH